MHKKLVGLTGVGLIASGMVVVARYLRRQQHEVIATTKKPETVPIPSVAVETVQPKTEAINQANTVSTTAPIVAQVTPPAKPELPAVATPESATRVLGQRVRRWLISEQYEQPERTRVESFNWRAEFVTALSDDLIRDAYQAVINQAEVTADLTPVQLDAIAAQLTKVAPIRKQLVNNVIENLDEGVALTRVDWQPEVAQVYATLGDGSEIMYVQINLRTGYCHG